mgnify:CR=1 FL=1
MKKEFKKTSLVHRDIGEHEHEMVIFDTYETHAVCMKCGFHDWSEPPEWSVPEGYKGDGSLVPYFQEKYPNATVDNSN